MDTTEKYERLGWKETTTRQPCNGVNIPWRAEEKYVETSVRRASKRSSKLHSRRRLWPMQLYTGGTFSRLALALAPAKVEIKVEVRAVVSSMPLQHRSIVFMQAAAKSSTIAGDYIQ